MSRLVDLRLNQFVRRALYGVLVFAWCSGITFYSMRRWFQIDGEFGTQAHPWQQAVLSTHGAAAFVLLMFVGAMAFNHAPSGWRSRRSRVHGIANAAGFLAMVLSGWCLYYVGQETARAWIALVHLSIGLALPLLLALHIWRGRLGRGKSSRLNASD